MKASYKVFVYLILLGVLIWVFNVLTDTFLLNGGSFTEMIYSGLTTMQIISRIITIIFILGIGFYIFHLLSGNNPSNDIVKKQKSELDKRVRELDSLYKASNYLIMDQGIDVMLKGICDYICPALQFVQPVSARIIYNGNSYPSSNYFESENKEIFDIIVFGKVEGKLEVCTSVHDPSDKFIKEEGLVKFIIDRLGKTIERKIATKEMEASSEQLRALTAHLHSSLEKERISISREIHDELGQVLTALKINLTLLEKHLLQKEQNEETEFLVTELKDMESIIDITIKKVRKLITNLRPEVLDNLGLLEALEWQSAEFQKNTGIKCFYSTNIETLDLNKDITIAIFRIYQEALTNVARHSRATKVNSVFMKDGDSLSLSVSDNGIGINKAKMTTEGSFGILGMKERAIICGGSLEFGSNDDGGATVKFIIPYI